MRRCSRRRSWAGVPSSAVGSRRRCAHGRGPPRSCCPSRSPSARGPYIPTGPTPCRRRPSPARPITRWRRVRSGSSRRRWTGPARGSTPRLRYERPCPSRVRSRSRARSWCRAHASCRPAIRSCTSRSHGPHRSHGGRMSCCCSSRVSIVASSAARSRAAASRRFSTRSSPTASPSSSSTPTARRRFTGCSRRCARGCRVRAWRPRRRVTRTTISACPRC